jgi:hypothetical protein
MKEGRALLKFNGQDPIIDHSTLDVRVITNTGPHRFGTLHLHGYD